MDTNPPSDGCFSWIEVVGPFPDLDSMERSLSKGNPYQLEQEEELYYYDGPIIRTGRVAGDERPRLDVMVSEGQSGPEGRRVYTETRHQLVFDTMETLHATLHEGYIPTVQSYRLAETILRYRTITTQIGHPEPANYMITAQLRLQDIPECELPYARHEAQGHWTPSLREKKE